MALIKEIHGKIPLSGEVYFQADNVTSTGAPRSSAMYTAWYYDDKKKCGE